MSPLRLSRDVLTAIATWALTAGALALIATTLGSAGRGAEGMLLPALAVLAASGAAALGERAERLGGLGWGAAALPVAIHLLGPLPASLVAGGAAALAVTARGRLLGPRWRAAPLSVAVALERVAHTILAVLLAALVWSVWGPSPNEGPAAIVSSAVAVGCGLLYGLIDFGCALAARKARGQALALGGGASGLGTDLLGWAVGLAVAAATVAAGWGTGLAVLAALAFLRLDGAWQRELRGLAERRLAELRTATASGERALARPTGEGALRAVVEHTLADCRRLLPFHWFQLQLLAGPEAPRSWRAGEVGPLEEGAPEPGPAPPALPGVHRRPGWKILEGGIEAAAVGGRGRLRLWCDPRRLDPGAPEVFQALLRRLGVGVERVLLDREIHLDPLTGLAARRVLEARLEQAFRESGEDGSSLAVIMCDLDHFKRINDTHGHAVGDQALVAVARALEGQRREGDLVCRYGGEEFTLLLERTDGTTALRIAERLRAAIADCELTADGRQVRLTVSAGVAAFPEVFVRSGQELVALADGALYEAKRRGRDRCLLELGDGTLRDVRGRSLRRQGARPPQAPPPKLFA